MARAFVALALVLVACGDVAEKHVGETLDSNSDQPRSTIPDATELTLYGFRQ